MSDWLYDNLGKALILGLIAAFGAIFVLNMWLATISCRSAWPDNKPQWSLMAGCTIEVDGRRIPSANYRQMD